MKSQQQVNLEATEVRSLFADKLDKMAQTLTQSEQKGEEEEASGELALSAHIDNLGREANKLRNGKFRFLIIGDFNRGKSSVLNVLLGQELLPVGMIATTAIPTFVRYDEHPKVLIHKKNGTTEEYLSLEEYKNKYTLNSPEVKKTIKYAHNSDPADWLNVLDYADFYSPVELLLKGVEFIDTAGLNHTAEEDEKTLSYIPQCHAIFFVLSAEQQLTATERNYLEKYIKSQIKTVFFLVNKWELVEESGKEEIHNDLVEKLSKSLKLEENEVEQMWGDTIFDVYAKTALSKLKRKEPLEGTGFIEFSNKLDEFLIHERLITELFPSVQIATSVQNQVCKTVDERLSALNDTVEQLEEKIKKVNPHINEMKRIVKGLEIQTGRIKDACFATIGGEYQSYFAQILSKIENDFKMPPVSGLKNSQKEDYKKNLEKQFQEYQQKQLEGWQKRSEGIVTKAYLDLTTLFGEENKKYEKERTEIKEILSGKDLNVQNPSQLPTDQGSSTDEISLKVIDVSATGKMILAGTGATVGTIIAGTGGIALANLLNLAGAPIFLANFVGTSIGISLVLTPIGWSLIGVSAIGGGLAAWWGLRSEIKKFQKGMQEKVKEEFQKLLQPDKISGLQEQVGALFVGFQNSAKDMNDDVESLETSLNNLLESKRNKEVDYDAEAKRLQALKENISAQWEDINTKYSEIIPGKSQ
jgi:GTPase Era involved in 16S rRNA processing